MNTTRRALAALALTGALIAPPTTAEAAGRCPAYERTLAAHAPAGGWSIERMSYTMHRESGCIPTIVRVCTGCGDTGLLQIHPVSWRWLASKFGLRYTYSAMQSWLKNPTNNVRAAAALCTFWRKAGSSCYRPWFVR